MNVIEKHKPRLNALCKKHSVESLFAFGSAIRDDFSDSSDIDFLVRFTNIPLEEYADNYFELKFSLESLFNREVDLLESQAIKNPYLLSAINNEKKLVYG